MRFINKVFIYLLKLVAPIYYVGKEHANAIATLRFGSVIFQARLNSLDAFALYEIWKFGSYKEAEIRKGNVVVDIGANIGGYAVLAAKLGAKVIAYEPVLGTFRLLLRNLKANNCNRVKSYNVAVGSKKGKLAMNSDSQAAGLDSIYQTYSFARRIMVPSIDMHEIFVRNRLKKIDILKLDVEGAEYDILLHARPADLRKIRTIIMEYHDYLGHGYNKAELKEVLQKSGFKVKELSSWVTRFLFRQGLLIATNGGKTSQYKQQPL